MLNDNRCEVVLIRLFPQLNEFRAHIMDTNQRLMAVSAELSMKQAAVLSLQQEIKEKEHQVRSRPRILPSASHCGSHYACHSPLTTIEESEKASC